MSLALRSEPAVVPKIKGVAIERLLDWYARTHGERRLRTILAGLPSELRAQIASDARGFGVLASTWYDTPLAHGILDGMTEGLDARGRTALAEAGAEAIVRANLNGVHKVLFRLFMTPERYATRAQALWERYYDNGVFEKTIEESTRHTAVVRDWKSHHPVLCEINTASARIVYEELGCRDVRSERTACVALGDRVCAHVVSWAL